MLVHTSGARRVPVLVEGGKVVGGIGISGGTNRQDGQIAQSGAEALK